MDAELGAAAQGRADAAIADALHTPEELQGGMRHQRAEVRVRVIPRLIARGMGDPKTVPTLLRVLKNDPDAFIRSVVAHSLHSFGPDRRIVKALLRAIRTDPDAEVREDALYSLQQLGYLIGD